MQRASILFTSFLLLTACNHRSDSEVRKNLPGEWHVEKSSTPGKKGESIFMFTTNGDFTWQATYPSGHRIYGSGRYEVKNGYLYETLTNEPPPVVMTFEIVQANDHKMVVVKDGVEATILKDAK